MAAHKQITIYSELAPIHTAGAFASDESRLAQRPHPSTAFPMAKIKQSIVGFSEVMSQLLSAIPESKHGFEVSEVQAHAFIDLEGGVQLLGAKLGGQLGGGLRFVWKRSG